MDQVLSLITIFLVLALSWSCIYGYNMNDFPKDFAFGSAISAYQYKEDVKLMAETGLDNFRISISWSRLIPNGRGIVNPKGQQFYKNLIQELVTNGVLEYIKQNYGNPPVYVLENGRPMKQDSQLEDTSRIEFLDAYIGAVLKAVRNGSNTRGYFLWSIMDLFELLRGYETCFGLYYVNFSDPYLKKSPKLSAQWYSAFLKGNNTTFLGSKGIKQLQSKSNFSSSSS
ncbi:hypothetical protein AALP_AA3G145100 [Arabis alpina]|uniref:Beta-glucosidase n=1 Tax=Arabis alpina TaxID=50452 RepID=A0A087H970_ARAAL|nr:hypothetical protein AALP_AA3G145100 [Arabis alpina]